MGEKVIENNQVTLSGEIVSNFEFSHEVFGEKFYKAQLKSERLSDKNDVIPIMVSERLINFTDDWVGQFVRICGQFRSYNKHEKERNRLELFVFVREIESYDDVDLNTIFLDGYICKEPIYRKTPFGREIADVLIAVNRPYGKSDYIPCICWGKDAEFAQHLPVGTRLNVCGRIQSREYMKRIGEDEFEKRIAYEMSVAKMEVVEEMEE